MILSKVLSTVFSKLISLSVFALVLGALSFVEISSDSQSSSSWLLTQANAGGGDGSGDSGAENNGSFGPDYNGDGTNTGPGGDYGQR